MKKITIFSLLFISFMTTQISYASSNQQPLLGNKASSSDQAATAGALSPSNPTIQASAQSKHSHEAGGVQKDDKEKKDTKKDTSEKEKQTESIQLIGRIPHPQFGCDSELSIELLLGKDLPFTILVPRHHRAHFNQLKLKHFEYWKEKEKFEIIYPYQKDLFASALRSLTKNNNGRNTLVYDFK
jgi:hypothetical protein